MVLKVYTANWTEDNCDSIKPDWDTNYAKKYRVQLYEPYNEPEAAAKALGLKAHTNLNNPTGIFSNAKEALYVMVEGTVAEEPRSASPHIQDMASQAAMLKAYSYTKAST